jgi:hypothetical protein
MPLSEDEQHALNEIEHTLSLDSPRLASSLRAARPRHWWSLGGQLLADLSLLLTGLAVVLIGVHANSGVGIAVGLIGYALVVVSVHAMVSTARRRPDARRTP